MLHMITFAKSCFRTIRRRCNDTLLTKAAVNTTPTTDIVIRDTIMMTMITRVALTSTTTIITTTRNRVTRP